jgi:hypothetical protein
MPPLTMRSALNWHTKVLRKRSRLMVPGTAERCALTKARAVGRSHRLMM